MFKNHWFEPSAASRARTGLFEAMFYQEEFDHMRIKNRQKNKAYTLIPRIQDVAWDQTYFGFSKLKSSGAIPAEVQRQLKMLGLISGKVKRN